MARVYRLSTVFAVALLMRGASLQPLQVSAGGPSPAGRLSVVLSPDPIFLGQRLRVTVRGGHPGTWYGFLMRKLPLPNPTVMDMGRYLAPLSGVIRFRPVTFTRKRDTGWYVLRVFVVQGRHITLVETAKLHVVA